jgi:hypothetical protein
MEVRDPVRDTCIMRTIVLSALTCVCLRAQDPREYSATYQEGRRMDPPKQWVYQPTTINGTPVIVLTTVDVKYE